MYQQFYQRFLQANAGKQHFACHSHHYWPDVTRDAMLEYWDDTARLVDDKWQYIFTEKVPQTQQLIADILHPFRFRGTRAKFPSAVWTALTAFQRRFE